MKVSEIVKRVRDTAGDTAVLQFNNATLTDWLNDAIRECAVENSLLQKRATSNTVAGTSEYTLPVDIFKFYSVTVNNFRLRMLTLQEWEEVNSGPNSGGSELQGVPTTCYVFAGKLILSPTPNSSYPLVINYIYNPASIVYTTDVDTAWLNAVPVIPESYHSRLVVYCLAQVSMQDDDFDKATMLMDQFRTGVINLKHQTETEDDLYPFMSISARDMGADYHGEY